MTILFRTKVFLDFNIFNSEFSNKVLLNIMCIQDITKMILTNFNTRKKIK